MSEDDDATLVRRACEGDRAAFAALVERHYRRIYRLAARILGDDAAEDLAQEVCIALPARLASWRGEARFTTWLYRVVVNRTRDAARRDAARRRHERDYAEADALRRAERARQEDELAWLRQALARMPPELRATAALVLEEGLRHAEAGQVLGISEATVSWRMHQLRKRLRAMAAAEEETP